MVYLHRFYQDLATMIISNDLAYVTESHQERKVTHGEDVVEQQGSFSAEDKNTNLVWFWGSTYSFDKCLLGLYSITAAAAVVLHACC